MDGVHNHFRRIFLHLALGLEFPRNKQKIFSVGTKTNRNQICFSCFSGCFTKQKKLLFSLLRTCIETTETNKTVLKQTKKIEEKKNVQPMHLQGEAQALVDKSRTGASQKTCAGPLQAAC
jgi:hypothetical protein